MNAGISKNNTHSWQRNTLNGNVAAVDSEMRPRESSIGIYVTQNLFNGFSSTNTMEAADFNAQSRAQKLRQDEQDLLIQVIEAYLEIWCCRRKVNAYIKREENIHKFFVARTSSYEVGTGTQVEIAEAHSKHQTAVSERINAETELISAESKFVFLTGISAVGDVELPVLNAQLPDNLETVIAIAKASSPAIISSRLAEEAALKKLSAVRGSLAPSCDLKLHAERRIHQLKNNDRNGDDYKKSFEASLQVTVPIFSNDGHGNTYSAIEIANQEALRARFLAENAIAEAINTCVVNWRTHISADARIQSSQAAVDSADKSSKANLEEEAVGLKSNTEIWANENTLMEAKVSLYKAQIEKIIAYAKLQALMGRLTLRDLKTSLHIGNNPTKSAASAAHRKISVTANMVPVPPKSHSSAAAKK
jgi:outer membrane protein